MRRIYSIAIILLLTMPAYAQITVQFVPEVYGRNLNGLFNCSIINGTRKVSAALTITVSERQGGTVCSIKTADFDILPGANPIPASAARAASIYFGSGRLSGILSQSRVFPAGDYEYCYQLTFRNTDNPPLEQCFSYTLEPFTELNLIDPYDRDTLCNKRPVLSWTPLLPGIPGAYYQLTLAEVKTNQSITEALNYNLPIVNQNHIATPVLPYPSIAKELENGKKYAWQVTAYKDQTILNRSEVWSFIIDCHDTTKKTEGSSYRDIDDLTRGNFYVAKGLLKFAIVNPYGPQDLKYELMALNRQDRIIKRLPKIKLETGKNQIDIDMSMLPGIKNNNYYILTVKLADESVKRLRILYKDPE